MSNEDFIFWIICCAFAVGTFTLAGYLLRKIKKKFLIIFCIVEIILAIAIAYTFMLVFNYVPGLIVAMQPLFLSAFFVSLTTLICVIIRKILKTGQITKIEDLLHKQGYIISAILGICILFFGFINTQNIHKVDYEIQSNKLKHSYNIVYISDLHYPNTQFDSSVQNAFNEISRINPDYLIIAGDLIDDFTRNFEMEKIVDMISQIKVKGAKFFVSGNHEIITSRYVDNEDHKLNNEDLYKTLTEHNIIVLNDKSQIINDDLNFVGINDSTSNLLYSDAQMKDLINSNTFSVCVDHEPDTFDENKNFGFDLQISGHYHHGQIFPLGELSALEGYRLYGQYKEDDKYLIVTSGFGTWEYPFRTSGLCEYVNLILKPEP